MVNRIKRERTHGARRDSLSLSYNTNVVEKQQLYSEKGKASSKEEEEEDQIEKYMDGQNK